MDRRTYEGPMDWEYQDKGPLDASSPFAQVARGQASQNAFASPSKFSARPNQNQNPFANSPSKPLPPLPQKSIFSPRIQQSNTAPPFRNPAFTTPRKPFDDTVFSEAESSPAMTEQSDQPNDTPDFDRFSDLNMGTITPAKIDKNLRYAKTAAQNHSKKHLSGRGEIFRPPREYTALRKRKRLNGDRDVGSLKYHSSRDDSSYSDADDSDTQRPGSRSRRSKKKDAKKTSWMASIFDIINQHPNLPDNLKRWVSFLVNVSVVSAVGYWVWAIVSTVRGDIMTANSAARREIVAKAASCQTQYEINGCEGNDRPALQAMCEQWDECRYLDPESIMVVRNTAKEVAGVFNAFATTMEYRSYFLLFGICFLCFGLNFWAGSNNHPKASTPVPPTPAHGPAQHSGFPGPSNQAYMYVPIETPSRRRQIAEPDTDATDTDGAPSPVRKTILPPPQTPSRHRFLSEKEGRRSPVKVGRSPYKEY